eukprot:CAMPEP_0174883064 /NCGR_PEP_ID=MMETSP1114-20130205/85078_1 /TAXON_ID=312471 /ORGANISM="Neobodo designis, Strain CCAP 1951/1" /LENGTH=308 /DNA_ID=CAMNT_0016118465 /DNA_START=117 /DNA_END=1041 /DNA_ORIENTATION=-
MRHQEQKGEHPADAGSRTTGGGPDGDAADFEPTSATRRCGGRRGSGGRRRRRCGGGAVRQRRRGRRRGGGADAVQRRAHLGYDGARHLPVVPVARRLRRARRAALRVAARAADAEGDRRATVASGLDAPRPVDVCRRAESTSDHARRLEAPRRCAVRVAEDAVVVALGGLVASGLKAPRTVDVRRAEPALDHARRLEAPRDAAVRVAEDAVVVALGGLDAALAVRVGDDNRALVHEGAGAADVARAVVLEVARQRRERADLTAADGFEVKRAIVLPVRRVVEAEVLVAQARRGVALVVVRPAPVVGAP